MIALAVTAALIRLNRSLHPENPRPDAPLARLSPDSHAEVIESENELGLMQIIANVRVRHMFAEISETLDRNNMGICVSTTATVFVVDDDEPVRDSIRVLLEVHGFEVEDFASTGEFARGYRKPQRGCLILDQHLPVTTGLDFLRSAAGRKLDIPVILITGQGDPTIEQRARGLGVAEYLHKPIGERVLLDTVQRVINPA